MKKIDFDIFYFKLITIFKKILLNLVAKLQLLRQKLKLIIKKEFFLLIYPLDLFIKKVNYK